MTMDPTLTPSNFIIRGGHIIDPGSDIDQVADIYIRDGVTIAIGSAPDGFSTNTEINAQGSLVIPGLVDLCVHIREPGQEYKGTIHSETFAAAAGGVTHLVCTPDTNPVIDTPAVASLVQEQAHQSGFAKILPMGALTLGLKGERLSEMHALKESGCIAMSQLRYPLKNTLVLQRCLEYATTFDLPVFFQSQDYAIASAGLVRQGMKSATLGLPGIPDTAETIGISRDLLLIEQTGTRAHFGQLSCARSVQLIASAQERGLPVTADVSAHQLFFTDELLEGFNSDYHVNPPFRSDSDKSGLREGLANGVINAICSDHQPHEAAAKLAPFAATEAGISAIETYLALSYQLITEKVLTPAQWVKAVATSPARIAGVESTRIKTGGKANICIFDPTQKWKVDPDTLFSMGHNTPLLGKQLTGKVTYTISDGKLVYQNK